MRDGIAFGALADVLESDWHARARPEQLPPAGDWLIWLILAGRGWGKTRAGAEWVRRVAEASASRIALVAATAADYRDTMVEGPSGILAISPDWNRPTWEPSKRKLTWPNGSEALCFSAEEPERLRGPQFHAAWCDELAAWSNREETWDQLQFGLRLGARPRVLVSTTPKAVKLIKDLMVRSDAVVTRGSTSDNAANLAATFLATIEARYAGTRLGRQELNAEILEDAEGALWSRAMIEAARIEPKDKPPLTRIVVAVDPAVSVGETSDETGIIVAGLGQDGRGYILHDASGKYAPTEWARRAVALYHRYGADRVVAEVNQGGDMVETTLRMVDPNVSYRGVHASRGKIVRAEPVSALYEQGRVRHVGAFPALEDQLTTFEPGARKSPDRLDALVWALTELMVGESTIGMIEYMRQQVEAAVAHGDVPDPEFGWCFNPAPRGTVVRFIVPPGMSAVMLMSGATATPDRDGLITCHESDATPLRMLGWRQLKDVR